MDTPRRPIVLDVDKCDRKLVIATVIQAMRDAGCWEGDIENFRDSIDMDKRDTLEEVVAKAVYHQEGMSVPLVQFVKDGVPRVEGDPRRLSRWQRIKRRVSLLGGSYVHPDGHIELDIDEKSGIYPGDSEVVRD